MVNHTTLSFKDHKTGEVKEVVFTATLLEVMEGVVGKITDTGIAFVEEQGELSIYTNPTPEQIDKFENNVVPAFRVQDIIGVHTNDYHLESNCGLPDENTDNESPDMNDNDVNSMEKMSGFVESLYGDMSDKSSKDWEDVIDDEDTEEWEEVIEEDSLDGDDINEEIPDSDEISDDDIEQVSDYLEDHPEYYNK